MTDALRAAFAPTGTLRAAINLNNPILAGRGPAGEAVGVSVDLARALAARLALPLELVVVENAARSVEVVETGAADVGFFAIDPKRAQLINFTSPYVLIEGAYLVRDASPLTSNDEVDRAGIRVVVGQGSAYDLYLSRALTQASIVRVSPSAQEVVDTFLETGADVAAGVRQPLEAEAARHSGLRLLPGRFMVIRQAMGVPRDRGDAAVAYLRDFVEEAKRSGLVAEALTRHRISGAVVAQAGDNAPA